jgi:hypothetical protein
MRNKILVNVWLPQDHKQEDSEYDLRWKPINFEIYSDLFQEMVEEGVAEWVGERKLKHEVNYEIIMQHIIESDGVSITSEYFVAIFEDRS